jgi:hypothetical protein
MRFFGFLLILVPISVSACIAPIGGRPLSAAAATATGPGPGAVKQDSWAEKLVNPITRPWHFESPTIQSEVRLVFLTQNMPGRSAFRGGDFQLYALQVRWAVNDKLAVIATKDGYIDFNPDVGSDTNGFADVAAGVKYRVWEDKENGFVVTPGLIYEIDVGDHDVFQGNGDGLIRGFISGGWDLDECNMICTVGYNLPIHGGQETHSLDYHFHVDYEVTDRFFPMVEINGVTYTRNANSFPANFEGGDLINLGATRVSGQTVMTVAAGARYRFTDNVCFGAAWEYPMTSRKDLFQNRVTVDLIIRW